MKFSKEEALRVIHENGLNEKTIATWKHKGFIPEKRKKRYSQEKKEEIDRVNRELGRIPFDEDTANRIISELKLGENLIKKWRYRRYIPSMYFDYEAGKIIENYKDYRVRRNDLFLYVTPKYIRFSKTVIKDGLIRDGDRIAFSEEKDGIFFFKSEDSDFKIIYDRLSCFRINSVDLASFLRAKYKSESPNFTLEVKNNKIMGIISRKELKKDRKKRENKIFLSVRKLIIAFSTGAYEFLELEGGEYVSFIEEKSGLITLRKATKKEIKDDDAFKVNEFGLTSQALQFSNRALGQFLRNHFNVEKETFRLRCEAKYNDKNEPFLSIVEPEPDKIKRKRKL